MLAPYVNVETGQHEKCHILLCQNEGINWERGRPCCNEHSHHWQRKQRPKGTALMYPEYVYNLYAKGKP